MDEEEESNPTGAKVAALFILCLGSLACGVVPIWVSGVIERQEGRKKMRRTITSVLLCFGGGVLFATAFCHIIPEVTLS